MKKLVVFKDALPGAAGPIGAVYGEATHNSHGDLTIGTTIRFIPGYTSQIAYTVEGLEGTWLEPQASGNGIEVLP
jgi:hypothetical protein